MKKMLFTLVSMLTIAASTNAMSYEQARNEALFLTDKMAYELNLNDAQYEAAYEINLDYLMEVTSQNNVFGPYWERRNLDLSYILYQWQWDAFRAADYFFRPLFWEAGYWHFGIYVRYPHRDYFYFGRPHFYYSYRGGHGWRHHHDSYYAGRHHHYRPASHRDHHVGMRNRHGGGGRHNDHGRSSTRVTHNGDRHSNDGHRSQAGSQPQGGHRNNGGYNGSSRTDNNRHNGGYNGSIVIVV